MSNIVNDEENQLPIHTHQLQFSAGDEDPALTLESLAPHERRLRLYEGQLQAMEHLIDRLQRTVDLQGKQIEALERLVGLRL